MIRSLYNRTIRPFLPRKFANLNGVAVRTRKLLDVNDNMPEFKEHLIEPLRELGSPGDEIVVIGGGQGVASVVAARQVGPDGHVTTFEASAEYVDVTRETIRLNRVEAESTVVHGLVGSGIDVWGPLGDAEMIEADDLPSADVLVIDAEGAELGILSECPIEEKFGHVIVETHSVFGSPAEEIRPLLGSRVQAIAHVDRDDVTFVAACGDSK
ncbi:hypothetical protein C5B91_20195 [Haloferax sp. Atlit-10N]|uniref:hypothetical protein n=1 Tax=unclassified Haloferax TaxID=2625095 RepID=UPI000E24E84E|nr:MULTISPECIES: hypothetical protein [unclassified Haloferax]RDZ39415.1 hypothetical protein C5B87_19455 [Haloferax sp. Atlit-16N]RDZ53930.1 hypothetical protein C5B91_20195 [Haloferax sp. Atlit-10N]